MTDKDKTFLTGLVIEMACQALPVRKTYPVGDVLDNEWPITWKMSEVSGNTQYEDYGDHYILVSNIIPTAEELAGMTVVAVINGETQELQLVSDVVSLGEVDAAPYATADTSIGLMVYSVKEVIDFFDFPTVGLYCMVVTELDSDIQFTLTKGGA